MSYIEFVDSLMSHDGYINYDNGMRNWRIGSNKNMSTYAAYKEYIGGAKDNFGAFRMSKKSILTV